MEVFGKSINYLNFGTWQCTANGVFKTQDKQKKYASPIPIVPTGVYMNLDSQIEKIEISFYKHGAWKTIIVPRSTIANKTKIINLSDSGVEVNSDNAPMLVKYFAEVISDSLDTIPHKPSKSVMGWVDKEFMPYTDKIAFDGEDTFKYLHKALESKGELSDWSEFIATLRSSLEMRLCIAASFASPLIELVGENPFVFHLWGTTSFGKTVTLMVAMSVWGNPALGQLVRTMNMTANSMLSTAAFLRNLPFAGDELQTIKSRWTNYDNLIMCITEGIDRGRMSFDKVNETKAWKCSFIFTGEEPCIKQASGGGAKNRVIEIECERKLIQNGNLTANFVKQHYGCAGKTFIEEVGKRDINSMYSEIFRNIIDNCDTTDKQAGAMALLMVADKISRELFWPEEKELTLDDVKKFLASSSEVDVAERAYQFLCDTIAEHMNDFAKEDDNADEIKKKRTLWGRFENDGKVYINNTVLDKIMNDAGFDLGAVKRKWAEKGYLERDAKGALRRVKSIGGTNFSCTCVVLNREIDANDELPF